MSFSRERYALLGAAIALFALLVLYHGAALSLPESLIDDATHIANSDRLWRNLKSGGIMAAIKGDITVTARLYNPGFSVFNAVAYTVTGENPMLLHGFRLALLAMVCCLLLVLPRAVPGNMEGRAWYSAPLGGLAAAVMFATTECPGWHDFHALQGNWYRLHSTDALIVSFASVHFLLLYLVPGRTGWRRVAGELASAGLLCMAITIKVTAMCYFGALVAAVLLLSMARDARWASWGRVAGYTCGFCILYFPLLLLMRAPVPPGGYGTSYDLSLDQLHTSSRAFKDMYWHTFGPILVATVLAVTVRLVHTWLTHKDWHRLISSNIAILHLWSAWILATGAYLLWKHNLPRYMLPGLLPFCAAAGIEIAVQIEWARTQKRRRDTLWFCAGVCAIMLLPIKMLLAAAFLIAAAGWRSIGARHFAAFNFGVLALGWAFFLVSGWVSNRALQADMVAVEHAQAGLQEETARLFEIGARVGFLGDAEDEHIGSMCYLLERRRDISQPIPLVTDDGQTNGLDYLLFGEKLNTTVQPSDIADARVFREFRGAVTIKTPADYWEWRRDLWRRQFRPPWIDEPLKNGWIILSLRSGKAASRSSLPRP